jgi:uncharacterized protein (TIGR02246 family)
VSETDTVGAFLDRVRTAWDAGDAHAYGQQFTEDASYVIFRGDALLGRAAIERAHDELFRWRPGTRMAVAPIDVRPLGPDTAVVVTVGGIGTGDAVGYDKFQTLTLHRDGEGTWRCVAFQNTEMSGEARAAHAGGPGTG